MASRISSERVAELRAVARRLEDDLRLGERFGGGAATSAVTALDRLEDAEQQVVLSLISEDAVAALRDGLARAAGGARLLAVIDGRYSTVMGIALEAPPEHRALVTRVMRQVLGHDRDVAARVGQARLRFVVAPLALPAAQLPEACGFGRGAGGGVNRLSRTGFAPVARSAFDETPVPRELVHELGHIVHLYGMSREDRREVDRLYAAQKRARAGMCADASRLAAKNAKEYIAEATAAYFGVQSDGVWSVDRAWLTEHEPALFALLERLYGADAPSWAPGAGGGLSWTAGELPEP